MAEQSEPVKCSSLRKNGHVLIKGFPCKIVDMSTSKTGKHGHAKVHLTGIDIFTEKKYEELCVSTHNMNVPIIERTDYQLIDIDVDSVTVLNEEGEALEGMFKMPSLCDTDLDIAKQIKEAHDDGKNVYVTVVSSMGTDAIKAFKVMKD